MSIGIIQFRTKLLVYGNIFYVAPEGLASQPAIQPPAIPTTDALSQNLADIKAIDAGESAADAMGKTQNDLNAKVRATYVCYYSYNVGLIKSII